MSAQANIVAYDGAATPVAHTFVPVASAENIKGEIHAAWREALSTVPAYAQITVDTVLKRSASGVYRAETTVKVPIMESISGQNAAGYTAAPKVAHVDTMKIIGYFHERSTIAGRRLTRQLALNIAGNVATSVAPVATGPVPELIDQLITAS